MIHINHVSKSFGHHKVLDDVSIHVKPGTIYGVIGENGAGKSTLIQCLVGIYEPTEGEIIVEGNTVYENNEVKRHIAYVADRNQFFPQYTIKKMIGLYKEIYPSFEEAKFHKYNEIFGLKLTTKVKNLSKGMQMRLSIMLSLATNPKVLVLDEPTSGLDAIAKKDVLDLLIEIVDETGMTVVISSHHLSELERICDEMTMIYEGKVIYQSSVEELKNKVRKLQIVFEGKAPEGLALLDGILSVDHIGSVYYIVTKNYSSDLVSQLKDMGASLVEPIGLNLEEVFIYTAKAKQQEERRNA
ncbi:ABC transporter ATP-binding protein [Cellulosilyticum ruminicola]|uniref:ABC transporter ATP-binding protein n=1 Tax=Cellulosilyticum ruminicola TaxID=425254 RepID=UPI0006D24FED|nr:ABC transporter ATP-binding protein [Cellulosilyticum ruminicola]